MAQPEAGDGHPRVLILGGGFDSCTGTGVTLSNLFRGWPSSKLAVVDYKDRHETAEFADAQYCRGEAEERWVWPLSMVARDTSPPVAPAGAPPVDAPAAAPASRSGLLRTGRQILGRSGADAVLQRPVLSEPLKAFISAFDPEVLYCHFSTLESMWLVRAAHEFSGAPLVVHIMDDWPRTVYGGTALGPALRVLAGRELRALLARASAHMAISESMAAEYELRYGYRFEVFHNCLDVPWWREHRKTTWELSLPLRLVYSGRIGWDAVESVGDVCAAVELLHEGGLPAEFLVYTQDLAAPEAARLAAYPHTTLLPAVENDLLPATLAGADMLVIPSGFEGLASRFSRLSMPTKVPAYMASGAPVVLYAPKSQGISISAERGGWGLVVGDRGPAGLALALAGLAGDRSAREALGRTAADLADEAYDGRKVRAAFKASLAGAAASSGLGAVASRHRSLT